MKFNATALLVSLMVSGLAVPGWADLASVEDSAAAPEQLDFNELVADNDMDTGIVDDGVIPILEPTIEIEIEDEDEDAAPASLRGTKQQQLRGSSPPVPYFIKLNVDKHSCLSFDWRDKNLYATMERCKHDDDTQKWYYSKSGHIQSAHNKFKGWCLTYDTKHHNRFYKLTKCDAKKSTQQWKYSPHDLRLVSYYPDKYSCMDYCRDCGHYVHGRKCDQIYNKDQQYKFY
jgi:hypothetical protein